MKKQDFNKIERLISEKAIAYIKELTASTESLEDENESKIILNYVEEISITAQSIGVLEHQKLRINELKESITEMILETYSLGDDFLKTHSENMSKLSDVRAKITSDANEIVRSLTAVNKIVSEQSFDLKVKRLNEVSSALELLSKLTADDTIKNILQAIAK